MSHGLAALGRAVSFHVRQSVLLEKSQPEPVTGAHTGRLARAQQRKIHRAAVASPHLPAGHGAQGKQPTSGPAGRPGSAPPRRQRSGSVPSTPWTYQPLRGQAARYCREGLAATSGLSVSPADTPLSSDGWTRRRRGPARRAAKLPISASSRTARNLRTTGTPPIKSTSRPDSAAKPSSAPIQPTHRDLSRCCRRDPTPKVSVTARAPLGRAALAPFRKLGHLAGAYEGLG